MMLVTKFVVLIASLVALGLTAVVTGAAVLNGPGESPMMAQAQAQVAPKLKTSTKPAQEVAVHVIDRDGKPVSDALVTVLDQGKPAADGRTDARRRMEGPCARRQQGLGDLRSQSQGRIRLRGRRRIGEREALKPLPDQLTLTLDGAQTVRVKAVDQDGKPIAGVNVGISSMHKANHEWFNNWFSVNAGIWPATDKDGIAVLDWLPERLGRGMAVAGHAEGIYPLAPAWMPADRPLLIRRRSRSSRSRRSRAALPTPTADPRRVSGFRYPARDRPMAAGEITGTAQPSPMPAAVTSCRRCSEQVYVVAVNGKEWAAPYRAGLVVHAGKPVAGVDFVLGRADTAARPRDRRNGERARDEERGPHLHRSAHAVGRNPDQGVNRIIL